MKNVKRKSCLNKLPECNKKCGRPLGCGNTKHFCNKKCHDSKCSKCNIQIKKQCRCHSSMKKFKCHDYQRRLKQYLSTNVNAILLNQQDSWIRCGKTCKRVMSCGIHDCRVICCPGKLIRGVYYDGHQCTKVCDKPLRCGRHRCSSYCHIGACSPCGVTYRNGVQCACGNVYVDGPFQCGTKYIPTCNAMCDKPLNCGHKCVAKCHEGDCSKCIRVCSKRCASHGILIHNIPCHVNDRLCGNRCGKALKCGYHVCNKSCHNGPCEMNNNLSSRCGQLCGSKLKCGHKCFQKCHGDGRCNGDVCKVQITVKCKCGNNSAAQYCRGRTQYQLKAVPCTQNCKRK
eukprot:204638_1